MKLFREEVKQVVNSVYCDCCGKSTTILENAGPDYATLEAFWGYGSVKDGTQYEIHLCENCFDMILGVIKTKRKQVLGCLNYPYNYDPLEGKEYM